MPLRLNRPGTLVARLRQPLRAARCVDSRDELASTSLTAAESQIHLDRDLQSDRLLIQRIRERLFAEVARLRGQWQDDADRRVNELRNVAVELALTVAAKFVHHEITRKEFPFESLVREMIGRLGNDRRVTVRLSPDDLAVMQNRLGDQPLVPGDAGVEFIADATMNRGDCRVESDSGMLVSGLSERFAQMRTQLLQSLENARH